MSTKAKEKEAGRLRIVSLGGVDEIGKNMYVFEYEDDIIVVDCGSVFPKEDMLGVDLVIPDITYLMGKRDHIRGYLFTHGHEDHIGATPYILKQAPAHIYGTKLTMALVDLKLKEYRVDGVPIHVVRPRAVHLPVYPCEPFHRRRLRDRDHLPCGDGHLQWRLQGGLHAHRRANHRPADLCRIREERCHGPPVRIHERGAPRLYDE